MKDGIEWVLKLKSEVGGRQREFRVKGKDLRGKGLG